MGRRVFYKEEVNGVVTKHHRFVYDNYLCVQKLDVLNNNSQINLFVWDPTEPVATRPLFTQRGTGYKFFYTCDGNKNVSELVTLKRAMASQHTMTMPPSAPSPVPSMRRPVKQRRERCPLSARRSAE